MVPVHPVGAPLTLAIDAATYAGTVAVLQGATVIAEGEAAMRGEQEERLMPAVAEVLRAAVAGPGDLALVVCGAGPGSFTSLRIAASIAKGLASARMIPVRTVSSLWLVAAGARPALAPGAHVAVLDAMRGEWFAAPMGVLPDGAVVERGGWTLVPTAELELRAARGSRTPGAGRSLTHRARPAPRGPRASRATTRPSARRRRRPRR
jgi:tRNA threonylcarbamoyladenosine biosynthesis protein TsaB